jgi:hypothetical protein
VFFSFPPVVFFFSLVPVLVLDFPQFPVFWFLAIPGPVSLSFISLILRSDGYRALC